MSVDKNQHPFSSDHPIATRAEDLLGRAHFSEALAAAIKSWKGKESLVIALNGEWGSGKTFVKNMVLDRLRDSAADCPEIVEFNPWQWAGQEQLANAFFEEIGKVLGRKTIGKTKQIAKKWKSYGAGFHLTGHAATGFRNALFGLLLVIAFFGIGGATVQSIVSSWLASAIGYGALGLAILTMWGGGFAGKLTAAVDARSAAQEKGLAELKRELALQLQALDRPVLVAVDDVDRLSSDEIRLFFQLIKAIADFPNLVYLVLFQRNIVEAALDNFSPEPGKEFLEKIVKVGLDIPRVGSTRLEQVLFIGLDRILVRQGLTAKFDPMRWADVFVTGLRPYFQTLQDVSRFLGTLEFHIGVFKKDGPLEVNPVDFIAVEALRVFDPAVYGRIYDAKALLASKAEHEDMERVRKGVEDILVTAPEQSQPQIKELLLELFPTIEWVFGGANYGAAWVEAWYRDLRICHRDVFDKYFYIEIPVGREGIAQADIERLLGTTGNRVGMVAALRALNEQGLLGIAIDRLDAYKQTIRLEHPVPFVTALFDIGDDFPNGAPGFAKLSPEMHISRIVDWYLKQEKDDEKRAEVLKSAMRETTGLYLPMLRASFESRRSDKLVSEDSAKELQAICIEKMKHHPELASVLYRWRDGASVDETRTWVQTLIQSADGVVALLTAFLQPSTSQGSGDPAAGTHWRIRLSGLEPFADIEQLEQKVDSLQVRELSERQIEAIKQFHEAIRRKKQGRPDDEFLRYDHED